MKARLLFVSMMTSLILFGAEVRAEIITLKDTINNGPCQVRFDKEGPTEVREDEEFDYFIQIQELSGCTLTTLRLEDFLPEGVRFNRARPFPDVVERDRNRSTVQTSERDRDRERTDLIWFNQFLAPYSTLIYRIRVRAEKDKDREGERDRDRHRELRNVACIFNQHLIGERFCVDFITHVERKHS
jgi:hypothetical protein